MIAEITARVRASMDPETVLRTALRELGAALGADRVMVRMGSAFRDHEIG
jgi:GAF domain-containing protein